MAFVHGLPRGRPPPMPTLPPSPDALRSRPAILRPRRALAGLRILLTGGSSGVGRSLAVELSRRGAAVFATARREPLLATLAAAHPIVVLAGDITDDAFRQQLVAAAVKSLGGLDVVIDDGSHQMAHVRSTLETLFPLLDERGVYVIEDLHAAYWSRFGGGLRSPTSFFRLVDELVDDMHHWYHPEAPRHPGIGDTCFGIHVHDSLVVLEKNLRHRPINSRIG